MTTITFITICGMMSCKPSYELVVIERNEPVYTKIEEIDGVVYRYYEEDGVVYKCHEEDGVEYCEEEEIQEAAVFKVAEEMPEFPGGPEKLLEYLNENLRYPEMARENDIQGRVYVQFVVEPDGSISNVEVIRSIGGGCDEEAVRLVQNMPKFKPGKMNGYPVRVQYTVPVKFMLND